MGQEVTAYILIKETPPKMIVNRGRRHKSLRDKETLLAIEVETEGVRRCGFRLNEWVCLELRTA